MDFTNWLPCQISTLSFHLTGLSCRLINPEQVQLIINGSNLDAVRDQLFECNNELKRELSEGHEVALIVTGKVSVVLASNLKIILFKVVEVLRTFITNMRLPNNFR